MRLHPAELLDLILTYRAFALAHERCFLFDRCEEGLYRRPLIIVMIRGVVSGGGAAAYASSSPGPESLLSGRAASCCDDAGSRPLSLQWCSKLGPGRHHWLMRSWRRCEVMMLLKIEKRAEACMEWRWGERLWQRVRARHVTTQNKREVMHAITPPRAL